MNTKSFQYYKPGVLPVLILTLGTVIGALLGAFIKQISTTTSFEYYHYPSTSVIVGIILYFITEKWWKYKPFIYLFDIPIIEGRYEGQVYYKHPISGLPEIKDCAFEIIQTGSKVKVNSYFHRNDGSEKTPSSSIVETIAKRDDGTFEVVYTYMNHGKVGELSAHYGTNSLKVIHNDEGKHLKGSYYTSRVPQTTGQIEVKLVSQKIKNDH